ncbi:asparagine synthase (glutamine-hydrolyzing) [Sulfurimonas sp.]|uniref:asparagine synthase (glutamine-hydrolyzing) n=1 Tax=Sulfurimonas sp. TaxID=2022749 RepID=UPI0025F731FB|nr:asparagine synthase (glutamine-hydrolyzing) [Sulfurimonas sp.]MDD5156714.1 asparagine synthase (glutamine-hydrolyzing) [Sulfurimonas sp.]
MCGLVGFLGREKNIDTLKDMLEIQSYRGPDDSGVYFDEESGINFGHNRLSIQDLSSNGHQPMLSDCGNFVIVFNGEVYNFKSIRAELEALEYEFISNSDTEVILYSYREWGIESVHKFIGMFAFVILDRAHDKLILVRDRAGVKPLYYYDDGKEFLFSSEIKSFHKHPSFKKNQNLEVLPYFFQFGYIPAPHTIFKNCYKLEAGHYLEYDLKSLQKKIVKYWDVNEFYKQEPFRKSEQEILEELEALLSDAIELRMICDVPVGVFLSGGYDSSFVASILAKKHDREINTFTIGFDDERYNEAEHAKSIAKFLGTNHTEYYMKNSDMLDLVDSLPFYYDEPFGDSSALPTMIMSKIAKRSVSVILSSDGGDEAFCGYSKYFFLDKFSTVFSSKFKKNILKGALNLFSEKMVENINNTLPRSLKQTNIKDKYSKFKRAINSATKEESFLNASSYVDKKSVIKLLKIEACDELFGGFDKIDNLNFLNQMMAIDYKIFMSDDVLIKVDRATMSVSLEGREPLLDHRIIEYLARVSIELKYKNREGKYLLRQILYKYLPKNIVDKPKSGFQIPLNEWLRSELRDKVERYLSIEELDCEIFNIDEVQELKKRFFGGEELGTQVWFILMYQMWKERWLE